MYSRSTPGAVGRGEACCVRPGYAPAHLIELPARNREILGIPVIGEPPAAANSNSAIRCYHHLPLHAPLRGTAFHSLAPKGRGWGEGVTMILYRTAGAPHPSFSPMGRRGERQCVPEEAT